MKAIVIHSGGLDSSTLLRLAAREHGGHEVTAISFYYGQSHGIECEQAERVAKYMSTDYITKDIHVGRGGALMGATPMPQLTYAELQEAQGPSPTYVPFRNATFIAHAVSHAMEVEAEYVLIGTHAEDAHNWAYPDCTPEFIGAMQNAVYVGTYHQVRLVAPFTYSTKADIVRTGQEIGVPFAMTHSCYEGKRPACGRCPTCVSRLEAFKANNLVDPLEYEFDQYRRPHGEST